MDFKFNQGFLKYFKNTTWLLTEKFFRIVEAFLIGIWLARYLGPEDFGILSYSQALVFIFAAIAALGLDQIIVRELVKNQKRRDEILGTAFGLKLVGFILMFVLIFLTVQFSEDNYLNQTVILIIATSIIFQSFNGIDFYFQSKVSSKYVVLINVIVIFFTGTLKIILILSNSSLVNFAYVYIFESLLVAMGLIIAYRYNKLEILKWRFKFKVAKGLLKQSWYLILGSLAASLYMKIDQIMIKEILNEKAVGLYSVAVKLSSIWLFVTVAITQSVFPSLVETRKKNKQLFLERLQLLYNLLTKISIIVCVLYYVFADYFVVALFGKEYFESIGIVIIYVWSIVFVFLSNGSWGYYLNENLEKYSSIRLIIGAIINIALNIFMINLYGLYGAAYATIISYSISGYFINFMFKKTRANFQLQTNSFINLFNINTWKRLY